MNLNVNIETYFCSVYVNNFYAREDIEAALEEIEQALGRFDEFEDELYDAKKAVDTLANAGYDLIPQLGEALSGLEGEIEDIVHRETSDVREELQQAYGDVEEYLQYLDDVADEQSYSLYVGEGWVYTGKCSRKDSTEEVLAQLPPVVLRRTNLHGEQATTDTPLTVTPTPDGEAS